MYIKNCHNGNFQHVMVDIKKITMMKILQKLMVCVPNLPLCYEIGAHMNNSIINWSTFLGCNNIGATLQL